MELLEKLYALDAERAELMKQFNAHLKKLKSNPASATTKSDTDAIKKFHLESNQMIVEKIRAFEEQLVKQEFKDKLTLFRAFTIDEAERVITDKQRVRMFTGSPECWTLRSIKMASEFDYLLQSLEIEP